MSCMAFHRTALTALSPCCKIPSMFKLHFPTRLPSSVFRLAGPGCTRVRAYATVSEEEDPSMSSLRLPTKQLPVNARVVICGGGVIGLSVAYHLAERGWTDVVVLEQGNLTCGTTWHSAGLIGRVRAMRTEMSLVDYSASLYKQWEAEGDGVGWKECGSLNVARTLDRMIAFKRQHAIAKTQGVESHIITPSEVTKLCPNLRTDDLQGAIWVPNDGVVTAPDVAMVFARRAKAKGVQIFENVAVKQVNTENSRVSQVVTSAGDIKCEYFVNAAGLWSRKVGKMTRPLKVNVPLHACEHYYLVTKPMDGIDPLMPVVRDFDGYTYFREWNGGVLAGGFEPNPKPCFHRGPPEKFEFQLLPEDWDHFQILLDHILHRLPLMEVAEVRQLLNGPESFTPDGHWLLGEAPEVANYFVAAGMNSKGIVGAGGVGKYIAEWMVDGRPSANLWAYDIRRFIGHHNNKRFLRDRMEEAFTYHYILKYPREEYQTGRKLRCSPLYTRQEVSGAVFGETMAYERAMYFKLDDDQNVEDDKRKMWSYTQPKWFEAAQEEYWACKERVCVMDMSSFSKFELQSANDEVVKFLQYLCSNDIDIEVGTIVHTGMQNEYGGYENDCTVARLDHNTYFMICPATQQARAWAWLTRHMPSDGSVYLRDVTSMFTGISIIGPHAQQLLADITDITTTRTDFRPMTCKKMDVGHASDIWAMRLTYTGEDGFILYIPSEYALHIYDVLMKTGKDYGVRNAGYYALRHLRIENFFAFWGLDLSDSTTPLECGRMFRVKFDKDFIGKEALQRQKEEGVTQRFVHFQLENYDVSLDLWPWGGEPIYRNGAFAGLTTTCGFGFALDRMVCLGFVSDFDENGRPRLLKNSMDFVMSKDAKYEIDIAGTRFPAKPSVHTPKQNVTYVDPSFIPAPSKTC